MIIRLDVTKKQLGYIIDAMSRDLQTRNLEEILNNPEIRWSLKAMLTSEFAERCELLTMLDKIFDYAREEQDDDNRQQQ